MVSIVMLLCNIDTEERNGNKKLAFKNLRK